MYELVSFYDLDPQERPQCVGYAKTRGRRCWNSPCSNPLAETLIRRLKRGQEPARIDARCRALAELYLCENWHRAGNNGQLHIVAEQWAREIRSHANLLAVDHAAVPVAPTSAVSAVALPAAVAPSALGFTANLQQDFTTQNSPQVTICALETSSRRDRVTIRRLTEQNELHEHDAHELRESGTVLREQVVDLSQALDNTRRQVRDQRNRVTELTADVASERDLRIAAEQMENQLQETSVNPTEQVTDLSQTVQETRDKLGEERSHVTGLAFQVILERGFRGMAEQRGNELETRNRELAEELDSEIEIRSAVEARERELQTLNTELATEVSSERGLRSSVEQRELGLQTLSSNLITQVSSEKEMRRTAERREHELQTRNTQLASQIEDKRNEVNRLVEQEARDHETRTELEARHVRWDEYNISWTQFNVIVTQHRTRNPLTFLRRSSSSFGAVAQSIPWPTPSGAMGDVSSATVKVFFMNSVPGLIGVSDTAVVELAIASLECEEARWRALIPRSIAREAVTSRCLEIVRSTVSDLLSDTKSS